MQFVYLCRSGQNEELRYSIRSVLKTFSDAEIIVIGEPPKWYSGDKIFIKQNSSKYKNVHKNLNAAIGSDKIQDSFVVMNDDFYILKNDLSYFHQGKLQDKYKTYLDTNSNPGYRKMIFQTIQKLKVFDIKEPLSYELHIPFFVEKDKLSKIVKYDNLLWRSLYGNIFSVGGNYALDVKVYDQRDFRFRDIDYFNQDLLSLSSSDESFIKLKNNFLANVFNEKSLLEND